MTGPASERVEEFTPYERMIAEDGVNGVSARLDAARRGEIQIASYGVIARDRDIPTLIAALKEAHSDEN